MKSQFDTFSVTFSTPCACLRIHASLQYMEPFLDGLPQTMQANTDFVELEPVAGLFVSGSSEMIAEVELDFCALPELSVDAREAFLILLAAALGLFSAGS